MNLHQLAERLLDIESSIESMLADHFAGIGVKTIPHVLAPLPAQEMNSVHARLRTAGVDCVASVIDRIATAFSRSRGHVPPDGHFVSAVSGRLQTVSVGLSAAIDLWQTICGAYQEIILAEGGVNKEEVWRYRTFVLRTKAKIQEDLSSARIFLQEIDDAITRVKPDGGRESTQNVRCPITGSMCDKPVATKPGSVFCGYQFESQYYKVVSLRTVIAEALSPHGLLPFFPDQQYEPIHISCQICHALQEASLCIFEISDSNPNVLFELGLAYMLGKTAILLAKKGSHGTRISDIAGIHRIEYEDLVERRGLIARALNKSTAIAGLLRPPGEAAP